MGSEHSDNQNDDEHSQGGKGNNLQTVHTEPGGDQSIVVIRKISVSTTKTSNHLQTVHGHNILN